jgi:hypothetical protein
MDGHWTDLFTYIGPKDRKTLAGIGTVRASGNSSCDHKRNRSTREAAAEEEEDEAEDRTDKGRLDFVTLQQKMPKDRLRTN